MSSAASTPGEIEPDYFFDTYALVEREKGSAAYARFRHRPIFTHQFNLYELAFVVTRSDSEASARRQLELLNANLVDADAEDLFAAVRLKLAHARDRMSYVDALGYVLALRHGKRYLTGDRVFKGLANVEFVT